MNFFTKLGLTRRRAANGPAHERAQAPDAFGVVQSARPRDAEAAAQDAFAPNGTVGPRPPNAASVPPSPDARGAARVASVVHGAPGRYPTHHASAPAGGDPTASAATPHARSLAFLWAALRPRDGDLPARRAHQAAELDRFVSALPPAARLDTLVELGLYVVTHDGDGDASQFLQSTLLVALARHAAASAVEQGAMATFARYFDDQYPFTTSRREGGSDQNAYEDQLTELYSSPAAGLLGYVYLRDARATGAGDADGLSDAPQRAAVPRYAYLQQTPAFGARSKPGR